MLINLSNHPYAIWSNEQKCSAQVYGSIIDLPFPYIDPAGDEGYIQSLCDEYLQKIDAICKDDTCDASTITVHIMGEMTFTLSMINVLQNRGIICIASTTERVTKVENGVKSSEFRFVNFRKYSNNGKRCHQFHAKSATSIGATE